MSNNTLSPNEKSDETRIQSLFSNLSNAYLDNKRNEASFRSIASNPHLASSKLVTEENIATLRKLYEPLSDNTSLTPRVPVSAAEANVATRQDYKPFYDALGRNMEKAHGMRNPSLLDQSYAPGIQAIGNLARHDTIANHQDEMDAQSGMNPKPDGPPSFAPMVANSLGNNWNQKKEKANAARALVKHIAGDSESEVKKILEEVKNNRKNTENYRPISIHEIGVEGDPAQTLTNGKRYLAETLGENMDEIALTLITGGGYLGTKMGTNAILDSGDIFSKTFENTGKLKATDALTFGIPSGVASSIPIPNKTGAKRITQAGVKAAINQIPSLLEKAATMDNTKGQFWTEEREKELADEYIKKVLFYAIYGG